MPLRPMIYSDYNGSSPPSQKVRDYLLERLSGNFFANPNASHRLGQKVFIDMENSRVTCAKALGTLPKNIIFNSGSTEGISQIFYGLAIKGKKQGKSQIIISGIEHPAVTKNAYHYRDTWGFKLSILPTSTSGLVDIQKLEEILKDPPSPVAMVAVMAANNETGVIQPYREIARLCQKFKIPYFSDTTQLIGKEHFDFTDSNIDYAVVSGHKIGGLTGTGLILAKEPRNMHPLIIGGGQEGDLRGGTQNYLGYETLAVALKHLDESLKKMKSLGEKRNQFEQKLKTSFPEIVIIGEDVPRTRTTSYISHPHFYGRDVQRELEKADIYVTTSSACSDNKTGLSNVLKSMGISEQIARGVIRISLGASSPPGWYNDIYYAMENVYKKLAAYSP